MSKTGGCQVQTTLYGGYHSRITLTSNYLFFFNLAKNMMEESPTLEDVADYAVEYFNVLCGHPCYAKDFSRRLLEKWPAAKTLFVSSLAYDEMVAQSNALGAKGFLYKPFHREEFLTKLADIVSV